MIEVEITDDMMNAAKQKSAEVGRIHNSITKGRGNLAGFLGEQIALHVLGGKFEDTYNYDIRLDDGSTVDVKTKPTGATPQPHYACSVTKKKNLQECDYYAFVRICKYTYSKGWFLGIISKEDFLKKAVLKKKGEADGDNGFTFSADCYNIAIKDLGEAA